MIDIKYTANGLLEFNQDPKFKDITGRGQSVAIIDTGIDLDHDIFGPDRNKDGISDRILRDDLDFTRDGDKKTQDRVGHGTAVAGIAASIAPDVKIIPIQVALISDIKKGINWVIDNKDKYNITGVNMSLGVGGNYREDFSKNPNKMKSFLYPEFLRLKEAGISATVSAGNGYQFYKQPGLGLFASYHTTNATMATMSDGKRNNDNLAPFSQRREDALAAPGYGLEVAKLGGGSYIGAGTSFASPYLASSLQLLQGISEKYLGRELAPDELINFAKSNSDKIKDSNYKQLNLYKAANAIYDKSRMSMTGYTFANENTLSTASQIPYELGTNLIPDPNFG